MNKKLLLLATICLLLTACAPFKATEYSRDTGLYNNYRKNFSFSLPAGYALLGGEERERMHRNFSDFASKDADYFFNKAKQILLICDKGDTFDLPIELDKDEVFAAALRAVRVEMESIYNNHPYIKLRDISIIDDFISIEGTYNSDLDDSLMKLRVGLYPVAKLSRTHAIFFIGMRIPESNIAGGEHDFEQIMSSLKLTAFNRSERIKK